MIETMALMLMAFLFGYFLGKRLGRELGLAEGKAVAPLMLREQSHAQGYCALCRSPRRERRAGCE
ncbi:MAG TPA: hypothetical protein PKA10_13195 [Selenomonadales bacterium]|nr:hypothetical protein [Selenomonadales bacterium]